MADRIATRLVKHEAVRDLYLVTGDIDIVINATFQTYGGMKDDNQREQIRSIGLRGGVDICWMEEAVKFTEDDYNEVLARMRGKAAPWRQILLSTNPDAPTHWIHKRLIQGKSIDLSAFRRKVKQQLARERGMVI